jgi:hypothetical protein
MNTLSPRSWDSVAGIETGYRLEGRKGRSFSPSRVKNFLFSKLFRPVLGSTQPPTQQILGDLSLGVKQPAHEAENSPAASADVKKMYIYTPTPPYAFMA